MGDWYIHIYVHNVTLQLSENRMQDDLVTMVWEDIHVGEMMSDGDNEGDIEMGRRVGRQWSYRGRERRKGR